MPTPNDINYSTCPRIAAAAAGVVAAANTASNIAASVASSVASTADVSVSVAVDSVSDAFEQRVAAGFVAECREVDVVATTLSARTATNTAANDDAAIFAAQLVEAYNSSSDPGDLDAYIAALSADGIDADRLVWALIGYEAVRHVPLIHHEANKLTSTTSSTVEDRTADDMISYGWLGLRLALRRFDPNRGLRFSTYACQRISGTIRDGMRAESHLPKRLITEVRAISRIESDLAAELGRLPTRSEAAAAVGLTTAELAATARFAVPVSLDELSASSADTATVASVTAGGDVTAAATERRLLRAAVDNAFAELDTDIAAVARRVLYDGDTVGDVARRCGVPTRRVRQHCRTAKDHLARRLAAWA